MGDVVPIGDDKAILGEPDKDVIETLKGLLKDAESGNISAIAFATVHHDGGVGIKTGWRGAAGTRYPLGAAIGILNTRYHTKLINMD